MAGAADGAVLSYDLRTPARLLSAVQTHRREVVAILLQPGNTGNLVVTGSVDGEMKFCDLRNAAKFFPHRAPLMGNNTPNGGGAHGERGGSGGAHGERGGSGGGARGDGSGRAAPPLGARRALALGDHRERKRGEGGEAVGPGGERRRRRQTLRKLPRTEDRGGQVARVPPGTCSSSRWEARTA